MNYITVSVEYMLNEREIEALEELKEHWQQYEGKDGKKPFSDWTAERVFQALMEIGCKHSISKKIKEGQFQQGLITVEELCSDEGFRTKKEREAAGTSQKA